MVQYKNLLQINKYLLLFKLSNHKPEIALLTDQLYRSYIDMRKNNFDIPSKMDLLKLKRVNFLEESCLKITPANTCKIELTSD